MSNITNNADTVALLKRVENLRKWQEEEQQKLLKAHEQQLQQFRNEQEKIKAKLNQQTSSTTFIQTNDDYELIENNNNNVNNHEINNQNDHLSTILEVSCEENNTPFKSSNQSSNRNHKQSSPTKNNMKKMLNFDVIHENDNQRDENELFNEENNNSNEHQQYSIKKNNFDEIPINGKGKSFEQLLEEKLNDSRAIKKQSTISQIQQKHQQQLLNDENEPPSQQQQQQHSNGKRRFLKRGEGLSRYQPRSKSTDTTKSSIVASSNTKKASATTVNNSSRTQMSKSKSISSGNLSSVTSKQLSQKSNTINKNQEQVKSKPLAKSQPINSRPVSNENDDFLVGPAIKTLKKPIDTQITANPSYQLNSSKKHTEMRDSSSGSSRSSYSTSEHDYDELKEFEELEKFADEHESFRSNASYIESLLATKSISSQANKLSNLIEEETQYEQSLEETIVDNDHAHTHSPKKLISSPKILQRKVKRINYEYVASSGDANDSDNDELSSKFTLDNVKRRLGSMDFCQSSQEENLKQQNKQQQQQPRAYDSNTYKSQIEVNQHENEFEDENTWLDTSIKSQTKKQPTHSQQTQQQQQQLQQQTQETAPVSQLMSKLFPSLKPKQQQQQQPVSSQTNDFERFNQAQKANNQQDALVSQLLKEKVNQLEIEMEKFRIKNTELKLLKEKYDTETKSFEVEVRAYEKLKQDEINQFKAYKDEEIKKLKAEKKLFEQHKKSLKEAPSKKERDEIDRLRKQVGDLQEELKTKETRWQANNNRLKDRIETLEREKDELKSELIVLEKQRLEALKSKSQQPLSVPKVQPQHQQLLTTTVIKEAQPKSSSNLLSKIAHPLTETIFVDSTLDSFNSSNDTTKSRQSKVNDKLQRSTSEKSLTSVVSSTRLSAPLMSQPSQEPTPSFDTHVNHSQKQVKFCLDESEPSPSSYFQNEIESIPDTYVNKLIGNKSVRLKEINRYEDGRVEKHLEDGTLVTEFLNGTIKEVSSDKRHTLVIFFNGDRKEVNQEAATETYFYSQTNVTQITYSDGLQVFKFPNGQIEKHYSNKTKEIIFPDKIVKFIYANGTEESRLTNGTIIKTDAQGCKIIEYPNKQREIHTKDYKRREYPDGSVKTVYTNGISETKYANGRVRVKDEFGNIISDKKSVTEPNFK